MKKKVSSEILGLKRNDVDKIMKEAIDVLMERHAKYGPGNISRYGLTGIVVRAGDKHERLNSFYFGKGSRDTPDEKIRDTWIDLLNYACIALLWIDGEWPKNTE